MEGHHQAFLAEPRHFLMPKSKPEDFWIFIS